MLSIKETHTLPKNIEYSYIEDYSNDKMGYQDLSALMTANTTRSNPRLSRKTEGTVKCSQYPSVYMLNKSSCFEADSENALFDQNFGAVLD